MSTPTVASCSANVFSPVGKTPLWTLLVPLAFHLVLAGIYVVLLPLWGAVPDEPLHYSHVKYVAEHWKLPIIEDAFRDLKEYYFVADPAGTAQHGPLYYWPAALIYRATMSLTLTQQQYVLRLWSVFLGLLMIIFAWKAFCLLFPAQPLVSCASTLLLTLIPHRLMISAVIYNDIGAAAAATLAFWLLIRAAMSDNTARGWLWAGLGWGLAMLAKMAALVIIPAGLGVLFVRWRQKEMSLKQAAQYGLFYLLGGLLLCSWLLARNFYLYGELFPQEPKPPGYGWLDVIFDPTFGFAVWMTLRGYWLSLWSQVGWLPQEAAPPLYGLLLLLTAITGLGLLAGVRGAYRGLNKAHCALLAGFFLTGLAALYGAFHRTILVSFHSHEQMGKHAQAELVPFIALAAAAWRHWAGPRRLPLILLAGAGIMFIFNMLSIYNLQTNLIPRFAPTPPPMASWKVKDLPARGIPWIQNRPDVPNRYLIHRQQSHYPQPQKKERIAAQSLSDAFNKQKRDCQHRHKHIAAAGIKLYIHCPVGPLMA